MNGLPIFKSYLEVKDIPWDVINADLDIAQDVPLLIEDEFLGNAATTIQLKKRHDFDDWAAEYRNKVLDIVKTVMPNVGDTTYEYVSQDHGAWFNRYRKMGKANWHNHGAFVDFVIVWYLQATPEMGGFVFRYNDQEHTVKVNTGDILVFPGTLLHASEPNNTDQERFLMSNNICISRRTNAKLSKSIKLDNAALDQLYLKRQSALYALLEQL